MKRSLFLSFILAFFSQVTIAQVFKGRVIDSKTGEYIPYVNIGFEAKGLGTVASFEGNFSLPFPDSLLNTPIKFSCIGYKSLVIRPEELTKILQKEPIVRLEVNTIELTQVTVKPHQLQRKILGNTHHGRSIVAGFMSNDLGSELGTLMKIKRSPSKVESLEFNIGNNLLDSVKFRVNLYSMKNGQPDSSLLNKPIYLKTELKYGKLKVDLLPLDLWVTNDFLVTLEWIEDYGKNKLYFSAGLMDNNTMYRKTSQDTWHKANGVGVGFNATVLFEK